MKNVAPFFRDPSELLVSIAALESRIEQRQQNIRGLAQLWQRAFVSRLTSWPVLVTAATVGFAVGLHADDRLARDDTATALPPAGRFRRALPWAFKIARALQLLPA